MKIFVLFVLLYLISGVISVKAEAQPKVDREFRAVWIATVDNIDFPTKKNLSIEEQKAEIIKDLELAGFLKMNAVIFQVRPMCDASTWVGTIKRSSATRRSGTSRKAARRRPART